MASLSLFVIELEWMQCNMELLWFLGMGLWNGRSKILTVSRKGKRFSVIAALFLEKCLHLGLSPEREAHPCLAGLWAPAGCTSSCAQSSSSTCSAQTQKWIFPFYCFCAFLTSAEVASTAWRVACQLGCPGYLWRYHFLFLLVLWLQRCTSFERFTSTYIAYSTVLVL